MSFNAAKLPNETSVRMAPKSSSPRLGISLIEILVVVVIIALLLHLVLPAVEMARESSRLATCQNNLRNLAIANQSHIESQRHLPTGGWSSTWVGDPNLGFGTNQPGGWSYNLLPFLELQELHDAGKGSDDQIRRLEAARMFATPIPVFACPSRRPAKAWRFARTLFNCDKVELAGRSDYAASIGNLQPSDQRGPGPVSLEDASKWKEGTDRMANWVGWNQNGVVFQRSKITPAMIRDGLAHTYFCGEKFLAPGHYTNGLSHGDDQSLYIGMDRDNARSTHLLHPPIQDADINSPWFPENDDERVVNWNFGSAHPAGLNMASCDGSVETISYDISIYVFSEKGSRDGAGIH
jgi:type II secretory pathway pseudopilin PulG